MATKKTTSMFSAEAAKRHEDQENIKAHLGLAAEPVKSKRKVRMNITLPQDYKDRLTAAASEKHLSASVLIQMWIDEHCV